MKNSLIAFVALLSVGYAKAQTADEIVAKHIEAVGGQDKLSQITSFSTETSSEIMGNQAAAHTTLLNGKGYKTESDFNGQKITQALNEKTGWMINPFAGATDAQALPDEQFKAVEDQVYFDPLFNYAQHGAKVELQGQEKVGAVNAYKLRYVNKDNAETTYYIDPATWYVIETQKKSNNMGQEVVITTTFSDYKRTDFGVVVPYTMNVDLGQFAITINIKKVDFNSAVDAAIFNLPK